MWHRELWPWAFKRRSSHTPSVLPRVSFQTVHSTDWKRYISFWIIMLEHTDWVPVTLIHMSSFKDTYHHGSSNSACKTDRIPIQTEVVVIVTMEKSVNKQITSLLLFSLTVIWGIIRFAHSKVTYPDITRWHEPMSHIAPAAHPLVIKKHRDVGSHWRKMSLWHRVR